jgi:hypothetical protein
MLNPLLMNRVEARNGVRPDPYLILYRRPAEKGKPRSRLQAIRGFGHADEYGVDQSPTNRPRLNFSQHVRPAFGETRVVPGGAGVCVPLPKRRYWPRHKEGLFAGSLSRFQEPRLSLEPEL